MLSNHIADCFQKLFCSLINSFILFHTQSLENSLKLLVSNRNLLLFANQNSALSRPSSKPTPSENHFLPPPGVLPSPQIFLTLSNGTLNNPLTCPGARTSAAILNFHLGVIFFNLSFFIMMKQALL